MKKNEIIELLKPKCNGYDLPLSLNIELIAELLVNKQGEAINNTHCCTELKDKKKLNYEEWKFSQRLRYMSNFTYKNAKGKLFESEDLVKMYEAYKSL
jgi:hypothetical protein